MAQAPTDPSNVETVDPEESSPNMIVYRKDRESSKTDADFQNATAQYQFPSTPPATCPGKRRQETVRNYKIEDSPELSIRFGGFGSLPNPEATRDH